MFAGRALMRKQGVRRDKKQHQSSDGQPPGYPVDASEVGKH
jgi:hypothetical protein